MTTLFDGFGARLFSERDRRGLSQRDLADLISVDPMSVSRMERGIHNPSPKTLDDLANCLECDRVWLAFGVGERAGQAVGAAPSPGRTPPALPLFLVSGRGEAATDKQRAWLSAARFHEIGEPSAGTYNQLLTALECLEPYMPRPKGLPDDIELPAAWATFVANVEYDEARGLNIALLRWPHGYSPHPKDLIGIDEELTDNPKADIQAMANERATEIRDLVREGQADAPFLSSWDHFPDGLATPISDAKRRPSGRGGQSSDPAQ